MAAAFTTRRIAGIGAGAFACILILGLLSGAGAFVWTIEHTDPAAFASRTDPLQSRDPDPAFSQKVRQMYALGGDHAILAACKERRSTWPHDPEAMLYSAFALERLAEQPGLEAFGARIAAQRTWDALYRKATDPNRGFIGSRLYMQSWALMGLGRPMLAIEGFGRYVASTEARSTGLDSYNRACYLAMAGETGAAQRAFARAARRQTIQTGWAAADPDLEPLHGTFEFRVWDTYQTLIRAPEWRAPRPSNTEEPIQLRISH